MTDEEIYNTFNTFWREWTFEYWMDEEDYEEVKAETFKQMGITPQNIVEDIKVGMSNGYSIDVQLEFIKNKLQQA